MNIGIDIDGTMTTFLKFEFDRLQEYMQKTYDKGYTGKIDMSEIDLDCRYPDLTKNEIKGFKDYLFPLNVNDCPFRAGVRETLNVLSLLGNNIFIITARDEDYDGKYKGEQMKQDTLIRFMNNQINYDKIIFSAGDKLDACRTNKIDVMIEDTPENIESISKTVKVLVMDEAYNRKVKESENIKRIYEFSDIIKYLE